MEASRIAVRDLTMIALFVAIIAVMAQITIPVQPVAFTMQTFAVFVTGLVLGAKRGTIAATLYLMLGALGAPVFSAFQGGFGMLIGTHGGYLWSFPLVAFIVGFAADRVFRQEDASKLKYLWLTLALIFASFVNLSLGTLYLAHVLQIGIPAAALSGMVPFLIPEALKIALAIAIAPKIRHIIESRN